jgi:hypothetical protein
MAASRIEWLMVSSSSARCFRNSCRPDLRACPEADHLRGRRQAAAVAAGRAHRIRPTLGRAASAKAQEGTFVFGARLADAVRNIRPNGRAGSIAELAQTGRAALAAVRFGVLSSAEFEAFIEARLPSRAGELGDYVVNRHQGSSRA